MVYNKKTSIIIFLISISSLFLMSSYSYAQDIMISSKSIRSIKIVSPCADSIKSIVNYLQHYLKQRTNKLDNQVYCQLQQGKKVCQFILATEDNLKEFCGTDFKAGFAEGAHPDSYIMDARQSKDGNAIYLIGKTPSGLRSAVNRFISKMVNDGENLYIKQVREEKSPFINIRLAAISPTARRQIKTGSILEDANYELWSEERLRAYPELFSQFGFSGIQVMEIQGYGSISGDYLKKAQKAVKTLALGAKDLNMFVSLDQWGDCPFVEGKAFCWEDPEEKKVLEKFFTEMAQRYGTLLDHIYIHAGDPGGATHKGCTKFKTPQLLTNGILNIFKKENPKILATMSSWANTPFWKHSPTPVDLSNYSANFQSKNLQFGQPVPDNATFLDNTWMPYEIGIALHRTYNQEQADMLRKAGRPVDVWGWYIGDMEMHTNVTLNTINIDKYYKLLPKEASKQIRIQTIELCFHGWPQVINTYAGAQKMWDPYRNIEEIKREFCMAAFGPANTEAMLALYNACENPWDYDVWKLADQHLPRPVDTGTKTGNDRLKKILADAETIKFPAKWKSNFALPIDVWQYVNMLKARVSLFLVYSQAMMDVKQARADGDEKKVAEIKKNAIDSLPVLPIDPLYTKDGSAAKPSFELPGWADYINEL